MLKTFHYIVFQYCQAPGPGESESTYCQNKEITYFLARKKWTVGQLPKIDYDECNKTVMIQALL